MEETDKGKLTWLKTLRYLGAVILLVYPLRHAFIGVDLMDAGYALGNYRFFDTMNETWKLATYLANVVGVFLSKLPFGSTWAGMNIYTGILTGSTAAGIYLYLSGQYGHSMLMFLAEFAAVSLCWAPSVVLYHYLGYILMSVAALLLYRAVMTQSVTNYIASGVILGACVAVRMPNITYMALILPVWYACLLRKESLLMLLKRTGFCILGYAAGCFVPLFWIGTRYGLEAYPSMVQDLFGMTETAVDYKPTSMLFAMFGDYLQYSVWLLLFTAYLIVGILCFWLFDKLWNRRERFADAAWLWRLLQAGYVLGFLVLLRFCYGRGMFGLDYAEYFSMYKWLAVCLLFVLVFCVCLMYAKKTAKEDRIWAVILFVIVLVTPLGSNNGLYPSINNLFLVAPVFVLLLQKAVRILPSTHNTAFVCKTVVYGVLGCVMVQSVMFGWCFVFHDAKRTADYRISLPICSPANGMWTQEPVSEELASLAEYLVENGLLDKNVILYGNIPALAYILDMESAIFTTWIDLDSNSANRLQQDLDVLSGGAEEALPVVIARAQNTDLVGKEWSGGTQKEQLLRAFLLAHGYRQVYLNDGYRVYSVER